MYLISSAITHMFSGSPRFCVVSCSALSKYGKKVRFRVRALYCAIVLGIKYFTLVISTKYFKIFVPKALICSKQHYTIIVIRVHSQTLTLVSKLEIDIGLTLCK